MEVRKPSGKGKGRGIEIRYDGDWAGGLSERPRPRIMTSASPIDASWARGFLSSWIGPDGMPNEHSAEVRGWIWLPVPDVLSPMEAEWLADAATEAGAGLLVALSFGCAEEPSCSRIVAARDELLAFTSDRSHEYVILTSEDQQFLYFKDQANRFYLLAGSPEFIARAYRCSIETARMQFEAWAEEDFNDPREEQFLMQLWRRYAPVTARY